MQTSRESLAQNNHIEALRARHESLEIRISEALKHPATSDSFLKKLKMQKLKLKEKIEQAK